MSKHINYQVIEQSGKPAFAVVPYAEFMALIDDGEVTIPHEVVKISVKDDCSLIKAWRLYRNKSQEEIAQKIKATQSAYHQLENSKSRKQKRTLDKLAEAFDCLPEQLTE